MKKTVIISAAAAGLLAVGGALLWLHFYRQRPEVLLDRLVSGKGDREELIMRLNVARGDLVAPMIRIVQARSAPAQGRADVLELLFKRNFRSSEPRIEQVLLAALKDSDPVVRRKAAYGLAMYAEERLQLALADSINDPDPQVRRQVYLVLAGPAKSSGPDVGLWGLFSDQQKEEFVGVCVQQMDAESDPNMQLLARAVVSREIETRAIGATQALQTSDIFRAEQILKSALELDPQNRQGQMRLIRFYFKNGGEELAMKLARKHGALIEIPQLSEPPEIDGDPADAVWAEAYVADSFFKTSSRWVAQRAEGKSKAYLGHRDGSIYIAMVAYEEDLSQLICKHTSRDSAVWRDDCVELCFDPANTERDCYKFTINPVGALQDKFNTNKARNFKCLYKAKMFPDRGFWACEFAIKGVDMDNHPIAPGAIWSLNLFRARIGAASEHGTMWPTYGNAWRIGLYPLAVFK